MPIKSYEAYFDSLIKNPKLIRTLITNDLDIYTRLHQQSKSLWYYAETCYHASNYASDFKNHLIQRANCVCLHDLYPVIPYPETYWSQITHSLNKEFTQKIADYKTNCITPKPSEPHTGKNTTFINPAFRRGVQSCIYIADFGYITGKLFRDEALLHHVFKYDMPDIQSHTTTENKMILNAFIKKQRDAVNKRQHAARKNWQNNHYQIIITTALNRFKRKKQKILMPDELTVASVAQMLAFLPTTKKYRRIIKKIQHEYTKENSREDDEHTKKNDILKYRVKRIDELLKITELKQLICHHFQISTTLQTSLFAAIQDKLMKENPAFSVNDILKKIELCEYACAQKISLTKYPQRATLALEITKSDEGKEKDDGIDLSDNFSI